MIEKASELLERFIEIERSELIKVDIKTKCIKHIDLNC